MNNTVYKSAICVALVAAFILLLPLVAMQFNDQVNWDLADFAFAWVLMFGAGLAYVLAARKSGITLYRLAAGVALAAAFILIWMNAAVGLLGSEDNPANLMYFGVLAVGIIGAALAHFRPRGMSRTLLATALAQALVPVLALMFFESYGTSGVLEVLGVTAFFVALFTGSALLFRHAAQTQLPTVAGQGG